MSDTLETLLGQVNAFKTGADNATQQVLAALGAQTQLANANADTYTQQAGDDATVMAAKQAADYKTQLARVQAANIAGANLNDQAEVLTGLSAAARDAQQRKDEALAAIQQKDSVSFIDNPLQYIVNQFTVNSDISKHNIANQQLESAHNRIMEVNAEAQQTAVTQNAISEPLTVASMAAATRSAAAAATVEANKAKIAGLNYGTQGIEFALNAKKEVLAQAFQANSAQDAANAAARSLESLNLQKQEFSFRQQEWNERQADKKDQLAMGQTVIDRINLGRVALLGPNAAPLDDISGKMALSALKGKGTLSTELQKFYDAGERTTLTGKTSFGSTPAEAAQTMQGLPVHLNPTQGSIKNILSAASVATSEAIKTAGMGQNKDPAFQGLDPKDKTSVGAAFNSKAQQILNSYAANVKAGDIDNPYQIASVNQLATKSPTIQGLPVYQKVLAPLVKAGVQLDDPDKLMSIVGSAVAKGQITHKEALELTTIYHVGVGVNLAMRNFSAFGLVAKNSYNTQVTTDPDAWTPKETVNLTDPMDVSRALMKMQASKYRDQMANGEVNIFTGKKGNSDPSEFLNPSQETIKSSQFGPKTGQTPQQVNKLQSDFDSFVK